MHIVVGGADAVGLADDGRDRAGMLLQELDRIADGDLTAGGDRVAAALEMDRIPDRARAGGDRRRVRGEVRGRSLRASSHQRDDAQRCEEYAFGHLCLHRAELYFRGEAGTAGWGLSPSAPLVGLTGSGGIDGDILTIGLDVRFLPILEYLNMISLRFSRKIISFFAIFTSIGKYALNKI